MRKVKVRKQHICECCNRKIEVWQGCLTYNLPYQGRKHLCLSCKSFKLTVDREDYGPDVDFLNGIY